MFGSVVLLPIKTLATGAIQGATSLRHLSVWGRLGIVLHTVLFFLVLWILPYSIMRRARMAALGLDESAPLIMPDLVLRMCGLFTCFQTTIGTFFGVFTQCTHLTMESMAAVDTASASGGSSSSSSSSTWAKRQVETAANFCEASLFWFLLSGGLNLQVGVGMASIRFGSSSAFTDPQNFHLLLYRLSTISSPRSPMAPSASSRPSSGASARSTACTSSKPSR